MRSPDNVETSGVCYKRVDEIGALKDPKENVLRSDMRIHI